LRDDAGHKPVIVVGHYLRVGLPLFVMAKCVGFILTLSSILYLPYLSVCRPIHTSGRQVFCYFTAELTPVKLDVTTIWYWTLEMLHFVWLSNVSIQFEDTWSVMSGTFRGWAL